MRGQNRILRLIDLTSGFADYWYWATVCRLAIVREWLISPNRLTVACNLFSLRHAYSLPPRFSFSRSSPDGILARTRKLLRRKRTRIPQSLIVLCLPLFVLRLHLVEFSLPFLGSRSTPPDGLLLLLLLLVPYTGNLLRRNLLRIPHIIKMGFSLFLHFIVMIPFRLPFLFIHLLEFSYSVLVGVRVPDMFGPIQFILLVIGIILRFFGRRRMLLLLLDLFLRGAILTR
mmetsp:Transcript_37272/g.78087  ORF Transcript_37272/g.78087 Transcript_37272/m.78087 type:complete len:229 (+) Transcript_37272:1509-2195(+)